LDIEEFNEDLEDEDANMVCTGNSESLNCDNKENIVCVNKFCNNDLLEKSLVNNNNEITPNKAKSFESTMIPHDSSSSFSIYSMESDAFRRFTGEKRKFSRSSFCQYKCSQVLPVPSYHGDSSSDEEMKELYSKHKCITSKRSIIHTSMNGSRKISCINPIESARPSLNFEKMQQTGKVDSII